MPRIPGYTNLPSVAPGEVPGVRLSPAAPESAFGGGPEAAQAFGQMHAITQDVHALAQETQNQDDLADVMKATSQLTDYATDLQFNPETGFLSKKGEQVRGLQPVIQEDWTKTVTDLSSGLRNDRQRMMFQKQADERWAHVNGVLANHTLQERQNYIGQQTDAVVASSINAGAKAARIGDLKGMEDYAQKAENAVLAHALFSGMPPEKRDELVAKKVSAVYAESIQSLLAAGQDLTAKGILDKYGDKMTENDKQLLAPHLLEGSTTGEAQRITAGLFQRAVDYSKDQRETGPIYATEKELQDSIDEATKDAAPIVKAKVESMAIRRYNIEKTAQKETQDATFQGLADKLRKTGDLESLQNDPKYATLDENDKRQLEVTASRLAKDQSPYAKVSDPKTVTKFDSMSREEVAALSEADMLRRVPLVTEAQYEKMSTAWKAARNKEDLAEFKVTAEDKKSIFMAIRNSPAIQGMERIKSEGDLLAPKNAKTNEAFVEFSKEIQDKIEAAASDKPMKRLTQKERDQIINDAVLDKTINKPQTFLQKYGPYAGTLSGAPVLGAAIGYGYSKFFGGSNAPSGVKVSDQERQDIRDAVIRISGVEPSEEKIARMKYAMQRGASRAFLERLASQQ